RSSTSCPSESPRSGSSRRSPRATEQAVRRHGTSGPGGISSLEQSGGSVFAARIRQFHERAMPPYHQPRQLEDDFEAAAAAGTLDACLAAEREAGLPPGLLLAISSRETGGRNVAVEEGHRRGAFGIDDRKHSEWLSR